MTISQTLPETREREIARFGEQPWPAEFWPYGPRYSWCVGWQTVRLGLRTGHESLAWLNAHPHMIGIAAFRAHYQFREVPASRIRAGMLVISNWSGTRVDGVLEAEHMEWAYSDAGESVRVVGANTGPRPGVPKPIGVWDKTHPLDEHILLGIDIPYRPLAPSRARRKYVAVVGAFVNERVPGGLPRTTAAPGVGKDADTGHEGRNYWKLVQTWGRIHGYYGSHFVIDGIPGPQSRICEAAAHKAATTK